jgi:hypothetical protein
MAERGLTQTEVKVPKFLLSVKRKSVFSPRQQGGKLRSSYPLKSSSNNLPAEGDASKTDGAKAKYRYFR